MQDLPRPETLIAAVAAFLRAAAERVALPGDVIFAALADEENWSDYGARYLVEEHADLLRGVRYAIGEIGGFTIHIGERRLARNALVRM